MYVARQPILDAQLNTYAYELLFRNTDSGAYDGTSSLVSTSYVIEQAFENGIEKLVGNHKAFINFDESTLLNPFSELLDRDKVVVELLETTQQNEATLKRVKALRDLGYLIALDDFDEDINACLFYEACQIIKFDLLMTPLKTIKKRVKRALKDGKILLAEKVETQEVFEMAKLMGFSLFQGYFFSKPSVVHKNKPLQGILAECLLLINELNKKDPSFDILTRTVELNPEFTYRLLKTVAPRTMSQGVRSTKQALTFIGLDAFKRWVILIMVQQLGNDKPMILIETGLLRGMFMEKLLTHMPINDVAPYDAFLVGMFSVLDVLMEVDMAVVVNDMNTGEPVKQALINQAGPLGDLLKIAKEMEQDVLSGDEAIDYNEQLSKISTLYLSSIYEVQALLNEVL